jgi:phage terminase large subunit-like protein
VSVHIRAGSRHAELVDFPYGEHEDLVDAISQAFAAVVMQPVETPTVTGGYVISGAESQDPR